MHCEICNKYIMSESQYINGKYYHNKCIEKMVEENQELKKQLEELKSTNKVLSKELTKDKILKQDCLTICCGIPIGDIPKLLNQQKEFINWLEKKINIFEQDLKNETDEEIRDYVLKKLNAYKEILSKYQSIIGGKDE